MIDLDPRSTDRVFGFRVNDTVTRDDYLRFIPQLERGIDTHGRISVLIHLESLHGLEFGALWEEIKFDLKHFRDFDRVALVGNRSWHDRALRLAAHFVPADARYFPADEYDRAWTWIAASKAARDECDEPVSRVLHATDFSDNAETALQWAITMCKAHDATLDILHVADLTSMASVPLNLQDEIGRNLETIEARAGDAGVAAESQWETGRPWEVISSRAADYDLVVVGARGHTPLLHLPLGRTADRVIRSSPAPVLTIHHDDHGHDRFPRTIVVPTDFSDSARLALSMVIRFFGVPADDALNVRLLHAWQPLIEYGDLYATVPPPSPNVSTESMAAEELQRMASSIEHPSITVTPVSRHGYPVKVIEEEAATSGADLVALGTHGHSGLARFILGSVAERVVHRVTCPVLSVSLATRTADAEPAAEAMQPARTF